MTDEASRIERLIRETYRTEPPKPKEPLSEAALGRIMERIQEMQVRRRHWYWRLYYWCLDAAFDLGAFIGVQRARFRR